MNTRDSALGIITDFSQERQSLYRVNHKAYEVIIAEKDSILIKVCLD